MRGAGAKHALKDSQPSKYWNCLKMAKNSQKIIDFEIFAQNKDLLKSLLLIQEYI